MSSHEDVIMDEENDDATLGISADFSMASLDAAASTSVTRSFQEDGDDDQEPPAKRARLTDTDMASVAHVSYCLSLSLCARLCGRRANSPVSYPFFAFKVCNATPHLS